MGKSDFLTALKGIMEKFLQSTKMEKRGIEVFSVLEAFHWIS